MNHLDAEEQARVLEYPEDFSLRTRDDVADQQTVQLRAASQRLSRLVKRVRDEGATIIITVNGVESAQLCPVVPRIEAKG